MRYVYTNTAKKARLERGKGEQAEEGEDEEQSLEQALRPVKRLSDPYPTREYGSGTGKPAGTGIPADL